ncbi:MAG: ABC transporter ATP-binding protein [Pararhodobacter sp.]|nr:ABC transporter ATP-binding protein [Pararhodobacter sp.]
MRAARNLMEVRGVSLRFGGIQALDSVDLDVAEGSITAIIGPNGAGKSSLYNVISGMYRPAAGTVTFDGRDITRVPAHKRAGLGIARSFQNIALFRGLTVVDNIKLGAHSRLNTGLMSALLFRGRAAAEEEQLRREIEREVIEFLEIDHIRDMPVSALSYGLQKRVELARALALRPKIIMLDEPVAGMNREETEDIARFILDMKEELGITVLLIEHDLSMVMDISDHVAVLNFGKLVANGTPHEMQNHPKVIEAYIGKTDAEPTPEETDA